MKQHKRIIFNGNNYADAWQKEAGSRGLLNLKNTVDALPQIVQPAVVKAFEKFKVLNERELHARYEINLENYSKTINVEAQLMVLMANRYILPAALEYQKRVGESVAAAKAGGVRSKEGSQAPREGRRAGRQVPRPDREAGGGARSQRRLGREAREVHARHDRAGHGAAAGARRPARGGHPPRDLPAADVSRNVVRQIRPSGGTDDPREGLTSREG